MLLAINYAIGSRAGEGKCMDCSIYGGVCWLMLLYILLLCECVVIAAVWWLCAWRSYQPAQPIISLIVFVR